MTAWFLTIHTTVVVNYSEYNRETGRVSLRDKMDGEEIGSESHKTIVEGLVELTSLDKTPEIHREAMSGGRCYNSNNKDMSRESMNTEAWHEKIMELKGGLQARAPTK